MLHQRDDVKQRLNIEIHSAGEIVNAYLTAFDEYPYLMDELRSRVSCVDVSLHKRVSPLRWFGLDIITCDYKCFNELIGLFDDFDHRDLAISGTLDVQPPRCDAAKQFVIESSPCDRGPPIRRTSTEAGCTHQDSGAITRFLADNGKRSSV